MFVCLMCLHGARDQTQSLTQQNMYSATEPHSWLKDLPFKVKTQIKMVILSKLKEHWQTYFESQFSIVQYIFSLLVKIQIWEEWVGN